jgi:hypothetical protein
MQNSLILCGSKAAATGGEERIKNRREEGSRTEYCVKLRTMKQKRNTCAGGGEREREDSREYG